MDMRVKPRVALAALLHSADACRVASCHASDVLSSATSLPSMFWMRQLSSASGEAFVNSAQSAA